jgi:hypothetical protein
VKVKEHEKRKEKNSGLAKPGNQPEFQSSIKKRTVNQTVVTYYRKPKKIILLLDDMIFDFVAFDCII